WRISTWSSLLEARRLRIRALPARMSCNPAPSYTEKWRRDCALAAGRFPAHRATGPEPGAPTTSAIRRMKRMISFPLHTLESAPEASRPLLEAARKTWSFVPTLHATLAESPVALAAYTALIDLVGTSTLDAKERQIAFLATSVLHGCEYCVSGHTFLA